MTDFSDRSEWWALTFVEQVALIQQTTTLPEVAEILGFEVDSRDKIRSPFNDTDDTPSCHLYEDHFYDYSTGRHGDIVDFVLAVDRSDPPLSKSKAAEQIFYKALRAGREPGDVERQPPREMVNFCAQFNDPNFYQLQDYLGILLPRGAAWQAGTDVLVPHVESLGSNQWNVYGVKVRGAGGKSAWPGSQFTHRLYSPYTWSCLRQGPTAIICEGESDCWAMDARVGYHVGVDVFALPSGASAWKDHWLADLEVYGTVYVCMDNDQAGQRARDKLLSKIGHGRALELKVPGLYNDAREAIAAGWDPSGRLGN
jgi:hypothetical protein